MLVATGNDVRVMSIKLADRLHNMRTLGVMRPEKQVRIAKVTRDVLIPLAERLGVQALKTELEDLVFAILHPEEHEHDTGVDRRARQPAPRSARRASPTRCARVLREAGITGRSPHPAPAHRLRAPRSPQARASCAARDFGRLLVLVDEDADCYAVLGELHTCFTPVVSEFKDFIAVPKFNLYQSLHTAIAGDGRPGRRSPHPHPPDAPGRRGRRRRPRRPARRRRRRSSAASDGRERVDPTRPRLALPAPRLAEPRPTPTPSGRAARGPRAGPRDHRLLRVPGRRAPWRPARPGRPVSTPRTPVRRGGPPCIGARVNGRLATLSTVLRDGDALQLFLGQRRARLRPVPGVAGPRPYTGRADRHPAVARRSPSGRGGGTRRSAERGRPGSGRGTDGGRRRQPRAHPLRRLAHPPDRPTPAAGAPGAGTRRHRPDTAAAATARRGRRPGTPSYGWPRCCTPVPPDAVTGFAVRGRRGDRAPRELPRGGPDGIRRAGDRCRCAGAGRAGAGSPCVAEAFGRPHLLADLTETIAAQGAAVVSADVEPPREQRVRHTYTLQLPDAAGLPDLMRAMRRVAGRLRRHAGPAGPCRPLTSLRTVGDCLSAKARSAPPPTAH